MFDTPHRGVRVLKTTTYEERSSRDFPGFFFLEEVRKMIVGRRLLREEPDPFLRPARRLAAAVIARAVLDIAEPCFEQDAREFFVKAGKDEGLPSFWFTVAGFGPGEAYRILERAEKRAEKKRKRQRFGEAVQDVYENSQKRRKSG